MIIFCLLDNNRRLDASVTIAVCIAAVSLTLCLQHRIVFADNYTDKFQCRLLTTIILSNCVTKSEQTAANKEKIAKTFSDIVQCLRDTWHIFPDDIELTFDESIQQLLSDLREIKSKQLRSTNSLISKNILIENTRCKKDSIGIKSTLSNFETNFQIYQLWLLEWIGANFATNQIMFHGNEPLFRRVLLQCLYGASGNLEFRKRWIADLDSGPSNSISRLSVTKSFVSKLSKYLDRTFTALAKNSFNLFVETNLRETMRSSRYYIEAEMPFHRWKNLNLVKFYLPKYAIDLDPPLTAIQSKAIQSATQNYIDKYRNYAEAISKIVSDICNEQTKSDKANIDNDDDQNRNKIRFLFWFTVIPRFQMKFTEQNSARKAIETRFSDFLNSLNSEDQFDQPRRRRYVRLIVDTIYDRIRNIPKSNYLDDDDDVADSPQLNGYDDKDTKNVIEIVSRFLHNNHLINVYEYERMRQEANRHKSQFDLNCDDDDDDNDNSYNVNAKRRLVLKDNFNLDQTRLDLSVIKYYDLRTHDAEQVKPSKLFDSFLRAFVYRIKNEPELEQNGEISMAGNDLRQANDEFNQRRLMEFLYSIAEFENRLPRQQQQKKRKQPKQMGNDYVDNPKSKSAKDSLEPEGNNAATEQKQQQRRENRQVDPPSKKTTGASGNTAASTKAVSMNGAFDQLLTSCFSNPTILALIILLVLGGIGGNVMAFKQNPALSLKKETTFATIESTNKDMQTTILNTELEGSGAITPIILVLLIAIVGVAIWHWYQRSSNVDDQEKSDEHENRKSISVGNDEDKDKEKDMEKDKEKDMDKDKENNNDKDKEKDKDKDKEKDDKKNDEKKSEKDKSNEKEKEKKKEMEKEIEKEIKKEMEKEKEKEREREKEKEKEKEKDVDKDTNKNMNIVKKKKKKRNKKKNRLKLGIKKMLKNIGKALNKVMKSGNDNEANEEDDEKGSGNSTKKATIANDNDKSKNVTKKGFVDITSKKDKNESKIATPISPTTTTTTTANQTTSKHVENVQQKQWKEMTKNDAPNRAGGRALPSMEFDDTSVMKAVITPFMFPCLPSPASPPPNLAQNFEKKFNKKNNLPQSRLMTPPKRKFGGKGSPQLSPPRAIPSPPPRNQSQYQTSASSTDSYSSDAQMSPASTQKTYKMDKYFEKQIIQKAAKNNNKYKYSNKYNNCNEDDNYDEDEEKSDEAETMKVMRRSPSPKQRPGFDNNKKEVKRTVANKEFRAKAKSKPGPDWSYILGGSSVMRVSPGTLGKQLPGSSAVGSDVLEAMPTPSPESRLTAIGQAAGLQSGPASPDGRLGQYTPSPYNKNNNYSFVQAPSPNARRIRRFNKM